MNISGGQKNKDDFRLSLFIAGYYLLYAFNEFIVLVLGGNQILRLFPKFLMMVLLCIAFKSIWKSLGGLFVAIEMVLLVIYFASYYIYGNVSGFMILPVMFYSVFLYLPLGICAYCIVDKEMLFTLLYKSSLIIQVILVIILLKVGRMERETYSMSTGYALILSVLIIGSHWLKMKKKYDVLFVIIDMMVIILFGSRGPVLCFAAFILLHICVSNVLTQRRKVTYVMMIISAGGIFMFCYSFVISYVADILDKLGYSSRTLRLLIEGLGTYDAGRNSIQLQTLELIRLKPWFGWGAVGGREVWEIPQYPHNIYLELLLCFGIPFGLFLSLVLTLIFAKGVLQKDAFSQLLAIIFVSKMVSLIVSDSVFQCSELFICIAFCLRGRLLFLRGSEGGKFKYYRKGVKVCCEVKE